MNGKLMNKKLDDYYIYKVEWKLSMHIDKETSIYV